MALPSLAENLSWTMRCGTHPPDHHGDHRDDIYLHDIQPSYHPPPRVIHPIIIPARLSVGIRVDYDLSREVKFELVNLI